MTSDTRGLGSNLSFVNCLRFFNGPIFSFFDNNFAEKLSTSAGNDLGSSELKASTLTT